MKKKAFLIIILILICGIFAGYRFLYHSHRDIASEDTLFRITAGQLFSEFKSNDAAANSKYADKVLEVYGIVTSFDAGANSVVIDDKLSATLKDKPTQPVEIKSEVTVKGLFLGYDELLEELKMDQATINN